MEDEHIWHPWAMRSGKQNDLDHSHLESLFRILLSTAQLPHGSVSHQQRQLVQLCDAAALLPSGALRIVGDNDLCASTVGNAGM